MLLVHKDDMIYHFRNGGLIPIHHNECDYQNVLVANCCQNNDLFLSSLTDKEVDECRVLDETDVEI